MGTLETMMRSEFEIVNAEYREALQVLVDKEMEVASEAMKESTPAAQNEVRRKYRAEVAALRATVFERLDNICAEHGWDRDELNEELYRRAGF